MLIQVDEQSVSFANSRNHQPNSMPEIRITSQRLLLRPIERSDLETIHQLLSLPETDQYNALGIPENLEETTANVNQWIAEMDAPGLHHTLAVERKRDEAGNESTASIDWIGLFGIKLSAPKYRRAELWYKLHRDHWNQGYATEATRAAIDYCFGQLDLHRIEATAAVENVASFRVMEKCGLQREGLHRKELPLKTGFADTFSYAILKSDWQQQA